MTAKVFKRGGKWRVELSGVEFFGGYLTWREAFDRAFSVASEAARFLGRGGGS